MKYKLKILLMLSMILMLFLTTPMVHATVYQASATHSICYPTLTLSVAIDTDADIWTATWRGEDYLLIPIVSVFISFKIKFEDDHGFSEEHTELWTGDELGSSGTFTIEDYTHRNTWTHTLVKWTYFFALPTGFGFLLPELWIDLYIGDGSSEDDPLCPYCPTLFVWDSTDYIEERILNIHAESDVTIRHEIQNTLALENGIYKLQLRELDNFTSHIDQVKLYAVDNKGRWNLCPLVNAKHEDSYITLNLLLKDENRVDLKPTEVIELEFKRSKGKTEYFIFEITGYNNKIP